jgi:hypothetical protein
VEGVPNPGRHSVHFLGGPGTHVLQSGMVQVTGFAVEPVKGAPVVPPAVPVGGAPEPVCGATVPVCGATVPVWATVVGVGKHV